MAERIVEVGAGTYDIRGDSTSQVTVPTLTSGSIDQATPNIGDTLTVSGSNVSGGPTTTYIWQVDTGGGFGPAGGTNNAATYDTTGQPEGDYRRGVSDGVQGPVYTAAVTLGAAATAPAQMSAPSLVVDSDTAITATLAADPADGGSPITSYDLRYSTDEATWTDVIGITSPHQITGLTASTLYYVQTRAVNAVGAGAWSASASATTQASSGAVFTETFSQANGTEIDTEADWSDVQNDGGVIEAQSGVGKVNTALGTYQIMEYNGNSGALSPNQYAQADIVTMPSSGSFYLRVRSTANQYYYEIRIAAGSSVRVVRNGPSGFAFLGGFFGSTPSNGDRVRIEADGTTIRYLRDTGSGFVEEYSGQDSDVSSGTAAIQLTQGTAEIDNFECGDL